MVPFWFGGVCVRENANTLFYLVNMKKIAIALGLMLAVVCILFALFVRYTNGVINDINSERDAANAEIERLNGVIGAFMDYQVKQESAVQTHIERIVESNETISEQIRAIESNPDADDWLDQPLPLCVQELLTNACDPP